PPCRPTADVRPEPCHRVSCRRLLCTCRAVSRAVNLRGFGPHDVGLPVSGDTHNRHWCGAPARGPESHRKSPGTGIAVFPAEDVTGVRVLTTISAVLLLISPSAAADRGIANIRVTPATSLEPANVAVEVAVERHADNRLLTVVVDSGKFYWSSERQLEGQDG